MPNTVQGTLRFLRVLYGVLLFSMALDVIVAERIAPRNQVTLSSLFPWYLAVAGVVMVGVAVGTRIHLVRPALEWLRSNSNDAASLRRWTTGAIISAVMFESVVLLGFALRFMSGTRVQSFPFYAVGIVLMLVFWPQEP